MKSKMQENPPNMTYKLHKAEIPGKPSTYQRDIHNKIHRRLTN